MTSIRAGLAATCLSLVALPALADSMTRAPASGIDRAGMDPAVRPQDDLFRHVNGGWIARTEIPADRSRWGSFDALIDQSTHQVRALLEEPAPAGAGPDAARIRAYYASFMDEARVEALGARPIAEVLARIAEIDDVESLVAWFGEAATLGLPVPIGPSISIDRRNSDAYVVYVWQGGLGLPDRDYYLRDDAKFVEIRAQYLAYLERLFTLAGRDDAAGRAARVMALETRLAEAQWPRVALRDAVKTYNRVDLAGAGEIAPAMPWRRLLDGAGLPEVEFVLGQPSYATALATAVTEIPLEDWRAYLEARLVDAAAPYLSSAFVAAEFDFNSRTLRGIPEIRPRWKRAVSAVNGGMGFAVGREYVARHFPPEAKARMDAIVRNLLAAMDVGIDGLDWMSPATRLEAHDKLRRISVKIGYPDVWRDYSGLDIDAGDLVGNMRRAAAFEWRRKLERLGGPVDRSEWLMSPQTVNAYYMPPANEIVFPAAILQPPFFDMGADDAVNYGAIGAVIGHEISHGFDDQGRRYDGSGNLRDWWTEADDAAFRARAERLIAQYDGYRPLPDQPVNGRLSVGENIGDLSGLAIAWDAWKLSLGGREAPVIDGYTGAQRFILGFGQIWRTKMREEALREQLLRGPHAPGEFRANGVITNFEPFYEAFDVKQGDGLWRPAAERVKIW